MNSNNEEPQPVRPARPLITREDRKARMRLGAVGAGLLLIAWSFTVLIDKPASAQDQSTDVLPTEVPPDAAPADDGESSPAAGSTPATTAADGTRRTRDAIPRTPKEIVDALGYPFVVPFGLASVIALWFAIERMVILRRRRVIPKPFVERFLMHLKGGRMSPQQALQICEENGSPVSQVFAHGIRKWGKPSVEVEQAIIDGGERQVNYLRKHLRVLNGVATVTPLIGLLGTVIGMISAFNEIANTDAMGKAQELAVGIALALLTTAAGLLIAIPCLILYMYLAGRVDALVMEMDQLAQNVVNLISAEALASRTPRQQRRQRPKPKQQEAV